MAHKPAATYIVGVFDKPHWRTVLTTVASSGSDGTAMVQDKGQGRELRIIVNRRHHAGPCRALR